MLLVFCECARWKVLDIEPVDITFGLIQKAKGTEESSRVRYMSCDLPGCLEVADEGNQGTPDEPPI